jgi:hypothetical protein
VSLKRNIIAHQQWSGTEQQKQGKQQQATRR